MGAAAAAAVGSVRDCGSVMAAAAAKDPSFVMVVGAEGGQLAAVFLLALFGRLTCVLTGCSCCVGAL